MGVANVVRRSSQVSYPEVAPRLSRHQESEASGIHQEAIGRRPVQSSGRSSVERPKRHKILDDRQVSGVRREQRYTVDIGRGGDRKINRAAARLAATLGHRGGKPTPFPCHGGIDWKRVERRLNHAESLRTPRTLVRVSRDEHTKMELRKRDDTDRCLNPGRNAGADDGRGVEENATHAKGSTNPVENRSRSPDRPLGGGVWKTASSDGPPTQARLAAGPSSATGLPETVITNCSPASARRRTSPTLLRNSFWGIVTITGYGSRSATN